LVQRLSASFVAAVANVIIPQCRIGAGEDGRSKESQWQ
jgi:hypothetical protein